MDPTHILQRVAEKYAQCRTYSDRGIVDFDDVHGNKAERVEFRTQFIRPDYLCFEWQDYGPCRGKSSDFSILWSRSEDSYFRYPGGVKEQLSLELALSSATGCSVGSAHQIPSLLIADMRENSKHLLQLTELEALSNQYLNQRACYVLHETLFRRDDHILWISMNDFALVRIYVDRSSTADESEKHHKELLANTELMTLLEKEGKSVPPKPNYRDMRLVTEYTYTETTFDEPLEPLPDPRKEQD